MIGNRFLWILATLGLLVPVSPFHLRHRRSGEPASGGVPYNPKKLDKMMNKAILQIILGDLHSSDMKLLKALNYSAEEVMLIRRRELGQKSLEAFNRQSVSDYENLGDETTEESSPARQQFNKAMEPHVVFKIRSEDFDENSGGNNPFQVSGRTNDLPNYSRNFAYDEDLEGQNDTNSVNDYFENEIKGGYERDYDNEELERLERLMNLVNNGSEDKKTEYEGLEWVGGDVYRVIPEVEFGRRHRPRENANRRSERDKPSSSYDEIYNDTLDHRNDYYADNDGDDNANRQNDSVAVQAPTANFTSAHQRFAMAHRQE